MGSSRSARQGRVVAAALLLFIAIFVGRLLDRAGTSGLTILYVLPIVLVGVELGRRAGIATGLLALALFAAGAPFAAVQVTSFAYLTRAVVFVLLGAVAGQLADRLRTALASARASARHFELARDLLCTAGVDGYFTSLNGSWEDVLGWTREELMAFPFLHFVHPEDRAFTAENAARLMTGASTASITNRYRAKSGEYRWIEWSSRFVADEQQIYAAARDVTERRRAEEARREAEERFRRAFDDSATGMALVGLDGEQRDVVLEANESLCRILGARREALVGSRALTDLLDSAHKPALVRGMERLHRGEDAVHRAEYRAVRPDGSRVWLDLTASLVRDAAGRPLHRIVQVLDVSDRKHTEEQLRFLADHDPLSGVFNRRRFEQELARELDRPGEASRCSALIVIDVDDFKAINDTLGHATGDAVIARLGDALRARLRTTDVVARLGGDEFALILRRVDVPVAVEMAHSLQRLAAERLAAVLGEAHGPVTLSIGVAPIGGDATRSIDGLLGEADAALYAAKRAGRNRVVVAGEANGQPSPAAGAPA